jgi:putrescine aminotransferase
LTAEANPAEKTLRAVERHLSPGAALSAKILGGGEIEKTAIGATVVLSNGREVLDFGSYGVALLGHRHPKVVSALLDALGGMPTSTRVLANSHTAGLASELSRRCGEPLSRVWLGSDGADAVEVSLKLARRVTQNLRILVVEGAFHGKTLGALALTRNPAFRTGLDPLLGWVTELRRDDAAAVAREADQGDVAAVIFEPVQGEGGVRPLEQAVLRRWVDDAHSAGAFVISDEIQAGLGRCGPFSPALAAGLEPDAVLFGKALGGGLMPLSAMVATERFADPLKRDPTWHTATFGGHPLSCAAGLAALVAIDEESPPAISIAHTLEMGLRELTRRNADLIVDIRGTHLMWGIQFASPGAAGAALIELAHAGLLVSPCLSSRDTIRLLPPMVTSPQQCERAIEIISAALPSLRAYV